LASLLSLLAACAEPNAPSPDSKLKLLGIEEGQIYSRSITVQADVSKIGSLRGVEFYVNEEKITGSFVPPYEATIDTSRFPEGPNIVRAAATVSATEIYQASVMVLFDNAGPEVRMLSPVNDGRLFYSNGEVQLQFDFSDASGVGILTLAVNDIAIPINSPGYTASFSLNDLGLDESQLPVDIDVDVLARDVLGNQTDQSFSFKLRSRLAWRFRTANAIWVAPEVASDGTIYVGGRDQMLYSVTPSGKQNWAVQVGSGEAFEIVEEMRIAGDSEQYVLLAANDIVRAYNRADGSVAWTYSGLGSTVGTAPTVVGNMVLVGGYSDALVALALDTGQELWRFNVGSRVIGNPAVGVGGLIVFGAADGSVRGIMPRTGESPEQLYSAQTSGQIQGGATPLSGDFFAIASRDQSVYLYDRYLAEVSRYTLGGPSDVTPVEASDGNLYVGSLSSQFYALERNPITNKLSPRWTFTLLGGGLAAVTPTLDSQGNIYLGSTAGTVFVLSSSGQELWRYQLSEPIKASIRLSPDETMVYAVSEDRHLYALNTEKGGCSFPEMVDMGSFEVMRYEASRSDASRDDEGVATDVVCSRGSVLPWTRVSYTEAAAACLTIGMDLCNASQWLLSCQGPNSSDFPYGGNQVAPDWCNGAANNIGGCLSGFCAPMPTGENEMCRNQQGVYDASGNVREWIADPVPDQAQHFYVRGGSYQDDDSDLRCSSTYEARHVVTADTRSPDIGFRCCRSK
jgi:outer membrane protein assembly factor BamB